MAKRLNQNGAVSIISVVIFATIITVLITAYMRSAVTQQAQSLSFDFSNRAFYAAESGVQDTIRKVTAAPSRLTDKNDCGPFDATGPDGSAVLNPDMGLEYTCQRITVTPQSLSGVVKVNKQSAIMKLEPTGAVTNPKLVIRWSEQHQTGSSDPILYPRQAAPPYLSAVDKWNAGGDPNKPVHALLRVSVVDSPTASINSANTRQRVSFFNPTTATNNNDGDVNFKVTDNTLAQQQAQLFNNATCYQSDDPNLSSLGMSDGETTYSCKQTIDLAGYDFSNEDVYLRVSAVYRDTKFSVQLLSSGVAVQLNNAQVAIDVTGRAGGSTYRRVVQRLALGNYRVVRSGAEGATTGDAALIAGEGICKQFAINNDPAFYSPPSCAQ